MATATLERPVKSSGMDLRMEDGCKAAYERDCRVFRRPCKANAANFKALNGGCDAA